MNEPQGNFDSPVCLELDIPSLTSLHAFSRAIKPEQYEKAIQARLKKYWRNCDSSEQQISALIKHLASFPQNIDDPVWKTQWISLWQNLSSQGYSKDWLLATADSANSAAVDLLWDGKASLMPVQIEIVGAVRQAIFTLLAKAGAIDNKNTIIDTHHFHSGQITGLPDESACIAKIDRWRHNNIDFGILSCTLVQQDILTQTSLDTRNHLRTAISERIHQTLREKDRIFRGEGWEWLILIPQVVSAAQISLAALRIQQALSVPFPVLGHEIKIISSCGAALYPEHGRESEALIRGARMATFFANEHNTYCNWYSAELDQNAAERVALEAELEQALHDNKLCLYFQPQISLTTHEPIGAEVLLRWRRDNNEWVPPPLIIEMAETLGMRKVFTAWLIRNTARVINTCMEAGIHANFSVNLTVHDLLDDDLPELLYQALETWHIPPERLTLELTESAMMSNFTRSIETMQRLRSAGFFLSLDDFGTGYSSMSYLRRLPLHKLKIDQSFVSRIAESSTDLEIVRTMVNLAHQLNLTVTAEGAENWATEAKLRELGCEEIQGYLYSPPLPENEFLGWWQRFRHPTTTSEHNLVLPK